jgi:diguanylate cyclase
MITPVATELEPSEAPPTGSSPMTEQHTAPADVPDPGARLAALVRVWDRRIAEVNFVPEGRAHARTVLDAALRRLLAALRADPFDARVGHRLGADLVASRIAAPQALGRTLSLLGERLLVELGISDPRAASRLAELLGQLAIGFTEALREGALTAAEDINRAERTAWREQQRGLQQRLQHALLYDQRTDLPNRAHLTRWLTDTIAGAPDDRLGLCLVALDRFTVITESLGTQRAEALLVRVAHRLRVLAEKHGYFLAHLGADVFAIAVPRTTSRDHMVKVADGALRALSNPFRLDGHRITLRGSAGIVAQREPGHRAEELLRAADISLGWARAQPATHRQCGRWAVFAADRHAAEVRRHAITAAMPGALADGEFTLDYQPLIRLSDGALAGVEALARWRHAEFGQISPAHFIPAAEDTGLIVPLGMALLRQACTQAEAWRHATGATPMISVNLSVVQLHDPSTTPTVAAVLRDTGWPAELLQLEITESAIIGSGDEAIDALHTLAGLGIRLAIDDFGTGYSSLAYLAELPVHNLKLAASFLRGIATPTANRTILPALINLSHDLGLTATAEGVETPYQAEYLRHLGCDWGQGYHLGRPAPAARITELLATAGTSR